MENLKFESFDEMEKKIPCQQLDDVIIDGIHLSKIEKTPEQKKSIEFAKNIIIDYLKKMGLNREIYEERIVFVEDDTNRLTNNNIVLIEKCSEANLRVIIHEIIHHISSCWNVVGKEKTNEQIKSEYQKNPRFATGFARVWFKDFDNILSTNLDALNEGITDLITRELFLKNIDKQKELNEIFKDVYEKEIHNSDQRVEKIYELWDEDFISNKKKFFRKFLEKQYKNQEETINDSYNSEVELVQSLLEKLAENRLKKENICKEEAYVKEWDEMQKAYLNGNIMYTRKIISILGKDLVHEINDIKPGGSHSDLIGKIKKIRLN